MSLTKQADFTRMSFPRGPEVCSFRISNWTVKTQPGFMKSLVSFISPLPPHLPCDLSSWCGLSASSPYSLPRLSPPSLSLVSLFHLNTTTPLPSYLILTSSCLMALTCALEAPGNQKSIKELELRKGFLVWRPHQYSAPPCPPLYHSASPASSLLKTFCLPHFFLPSQKKYLVMALSTFVPPKTLQSSSWTSLSSFLTSLFSLHMLSAINLDLY